MIGCLGWWFFPKSGISVIVFLCCLRFVQGMAAGGELPGAMCYLSECAPKNEKAYICSFSFLGPQIGVLISQIETYIFETRFSHEFIERYGWRISFILGGTFAFLALLFRTKLEESPGFQALKEKALTSRKPVIDAIHYWKKLLGGFFSSLLAAVGFYMFAVFVEMYFDEVFNISKSNNLLIAMSMMVISTATLTILGKLGDKFSKKHILILSSLLILALSVSSLIFYRTFFAIISIFLFLFLLNLQFAILPVFISELFPDTIRYTGIALSFTLCDSIVGGATPWLASLLTKKIGAVDTFLNFTIAGSIISLVAFYLTNKYRQIKS